MFIVHQNISKPDADLEHLQNQKKENAKMLENRATDHLQTC